MVCLACLTLADPVVVIDHDMYDDVNCRQERVTDMESLKEHLANNPQLKAYLVEGLEGATQQVMGSVKALLRDSGLSEEQVSSFISEQGNRLKGLERIGMERAARVVQEEEAVLVFEGRRQQPRLLATADDKKSLMFQSMTPSILSGLLVGLFLIVMLCIGISCNYNIKTNDKYGRNNLWVGKES